MPKTALCYKHSRDLASTAILLAEKYQNGSEQKPELLKDVNAAIAVWKREKSPNISIDEQLGRITQAKVSRYIGGSTASDSLYGSRLRRHKVNLMFPGVERWYDKFIEFVVKNFEQSKTDEEIVLSLIQKQKVKKTA